MSTQFDTLSPKEAAYIAHNVYFTLKDWITTKPAIGMESPSKVRQMVTGDGMGAAAMAGRANSSLRGTDIGKDGAKVNSVFTGTTAGVKTGFGYVLTFQRGGLKHAVVATRGTRMEHSPADGLADAHAAITSFSGFGQVHAGFHNAYRSIVPNLARDERRIMDADVVHCVGHSLGGAIATLLAVEYGLRRPNVKLYTFGSPRVGAYATPAAFETVLGKENIYRVAHDLDPVTLVGPYPYAHVNGLPTDPNNMMLRSPTAKLISFANHDMFEYIESVAPASGEVFSWDDIRVFSSAVSHDNAVLARWLLRSIDKPSWATQQAISGLSVLLKAFAGFLQKFTSAVIGGMTAIDVFSAALAAGIDRYAANNPEIIVGLRAAAQLARIVVTRTAQFTATVIRAILEHMLSVLRPLAQRAVSVVGRGGAMPLVIAGASALTGTHIGA